jgi:NADH:ubiquinone oxidoreductase subunit 3 (subunit A)
VAMGVVVVAVVVVTAVATVIATTIVSNANHVGNQRYTRIKNRYGAGKSSAPYPFICLNLWAHFLASGMTFNDNFSVPRTTSKRYS